MAWTLSEIVARLGGELHGEDRSVARLAPLDEAGADEIAFVTGAKHADALLFLTHTPHAYQPGKLHDGNVITRLVQVAPTALVNGGRAPCWEVYGRPNVEFSGVPAGHSSNHPAGGASAGTQG